MFLKVSIILTILLFGTCLSVPIHGDGEAKETGKPFHYNENEQRQLDTAVSALIGSLLPQLQSTLSSAIQGAAMNLVGNFSIWDLLRDNGVPNEYLEDSPAFDSYVVNLPNVGSYVMLAANKPTDNYDQKPIILSKPIGLEKSQGSVYYKPTLSLPYKPAHHSSDVEYDKPDYVQDYKPLPTKKPYYHQIGSTVTLASSNDDKPDILQHLYKKKVSFSEQLMALQHKFHEQKEKIIAETANHINKLQAQLLGQLDDDYHSAPHYNNHENEYESPEIIKKPIRVKPLSHYVGFKSTNVQRDADFE